MSIDEGVEEEEGEWWEPEPLFSMHYQVTLEDGQQVTIFRNMNTGGWYELENPQQPGHDNGYPSITFSSTLARTVPLGI